MPTNVKTGSVKFPWPLGKLQPGASYATVSIPLTTNTQPVNVDGTADNFFNGIFIQADVNNSGTIYVCSNASGPDLTNYTNVLGELLPGGSFPRGKEWANNRDITGLFIGATNATDFAIASLDQF